MKKRNGLVQMRAKKRQWLFFTLLFGIAIVIMFLVRNNHNIEINPNILAGGLLFEYPANAAERFSELIEDTKLEEIFIGDKINIFFDYKRWVSRIKDRGVSHQAIYTVDNTKIIYQVKALKHKRLYFSIYNPAGSKLFYRIYLEAGNRKQKVYNGFFQEMNFFSGHVNLDSSFKKNTRIVFETRGKGLGAWVNPRFARIQNIPRVFVVILIDTWRQDHASLYGYKRKTTPVFDSLAVDSRVFNNAYSSTSWTLPAHVSLFSGKNLVEHKVTAPESRIPEDYPLLAEVFQKNGFVTAAFTGGGFVDDHYGFHRGFQFYSNLPGRVFHLNSAEMVLKHFKNYIETYSGDDIFVFLHTYQVHAPYKFPPKYVRHFNKNLKVNLKGPGNFIRDKKTGYYKPIAEENRLVLVDLYDTAIYYTDEVLVGGVIRYLKDKGLYDQAMIVVTSDHGEEFYEHGSWEHGHSLYNELIKIPLVIKYPGRRVTGSENSLVSITDIPGILLKESGARYDDTHFPVHVGEKDRVLPLFFPRSPIIQQVPVKISFVNDNFHFIYNIIDREELKVFSPLPRNLHIFELYDRNDKTDSNNLAKKKTKTMNYFRELLKSYLPLLRNLEGKKSQLDKNLEKELKSLGYLND